MREEEGGGSQDMNALSLNKVRDFYRFLAAEKAIPQRLPYAPLDYPTIYCKPEQSLVTAAEGAHYCPGQGPGQRDKVACHHHTMKCTVNTMDFFG